ncbi:hypothetical protein TWF481_007404 [Arthrobotrys musiformis]|uniref:Uncharacterized protein n=1 Tax=Arthrobotrys musiformis TaxID=47236 RepID=A0AAV9WBJ5_9PEZI
MQIAGLTVLVAALLVNFSLASPITPRRLEARAPSPIAARRLEVRAPSPIVSRKLEVRQVSPITARRLEARAASPIAARRLEARDETAILAADCSKYRFKPTDTKKEDKGLDAKCPKFCEAAKKHPDGPSGSRFKQMVVVNCYIPPPPAV